MLKAKARAVMSPRLVGAVVKITPKKGRERAEPPSRRGLPDGYFGSTQLAWQTSRWEGSIAGLSKTMPSDRYIVKLDLSLRPKGQDRAHELVE